MPYTRKDLTQEINSEIDDRLASGQAINVSWLIQSILAIHPEDDLSDFSKCARFEFVNDEVGRCVRRFKEPEPEELAQLTLPGFKKLQKAYRLTRNDEAIIVPIEAMSDDELEAKAIEHDEASRGHRTHARELRRYIKARRRLAAA